MKTPPSMTLALALIVVACSPAATVPSAAVMTAEPTAAKPSVPATPSPTQDRRLALTYDPALPYRLRLALPAGWFHEAGAYVISKVSGTTDIALATWAVDTVYSDGCQWSAEGSELAVGPTVDDLVAALAGARDRETTVPVAITVDGYAGKELRTSIPERFDPDFSECDEGGVGTMYRYWTSPTGGVRYAQGPGERSRILILDVDGTRVLVFGRTYPATLPSDVAELDSMLDSLDIESLAGPSAAP